MGRGAHASAVALARTIHENTPQTSQTVAWWHFANSVVLDDPTGSTPGPESTKHRQATSCCVWDASS